MILVDEENLTTQIFHPITAKKLSLRVEDKEKTTPAYWPNYFSEMIVYDSRR